VYLFLTESPLNVHLPHCRENTGECAAEERPAYERGEKQEEARTMHRNRRLRHAHDSIKEAARCVEEHFKRDAPPNEVVMCKAPIEHIRVQFDERRCGIWWRCRAEANVGALSSAHVPDCRQRSERGKEKRSARKERKRRRGKHGVMADIISREKEREMVTWKKMR
jgi:hypothetical protein